MDWRYGNGCESPVFLRLCEEKGIPIVTRDDSKTLGDPFISCPAEPDEHPRVGRIGINDLHIILPTPKVRDFMFTWQSQLIVTESVEKAFRRNGVTGYELRPVVITGVQRRRSASVTLPKLSELRVTGWAGMAAPESGIRLHYRCPACLYTEYTRPDNISRLIDITQWDGSDFVLVWPLPKFVFVTEKVRDIVKEEKLTGADFVPLPDVRMLGQDQILAPGHLWYYFERERAMKLGEPLGID